MRSYRVASRRAACVAALLPLVAAWAGPGCRHETTPTEPPPVPRDTVGPALRVVFPSEAYGAYDRDSDGLADVEVAWSDSGGAVNPESFRLVCGDCLAGSAQDTNLAAGWRTVRRDGSGAVLEETVPLLMRSGTHLLRLTVKDTAGNASPERLIYLNLPPGAYSRTIDLAYHPEWQDARASHLVLTPDGRKGFVPFIDGHLAIFDPEGISPTRYMGPISNSCNGAEISLDAATRLAYVGGGGCDTPGIQVVDTRTERALPWYPVGMGVAGVEVIGDRIYVGESCTTGRIIVLNKATMQELGRIEVNATPYEAVCLNARTFAVSTDGTDGWGGLVDAGLVRFDPRTFVVKRRFDVDPFSLPNAYGSVKDVLLLDDRWLYTARLDRGLDEWDTRSDSSITAHYGTLVKELALSPDGKQLFASAAPDFTLEGTYTRAPLLFQVPGLRLRYAYPPRPGIIGDGVVFDPDGKRVYMISSFNVDVYLVRPM